MVRSMAGRIRDFEFARASVSVSPPSRMRNFPWAPAEFLRITGATYPARGRAALVQQSRRINHVRRSKVVYVNGQPCGLSRTSEPEAPA